MIRLEKRRPFRSAAATAAARRITAAAAVIGLVIKIGHLLFALALEAAHHVLKAQVVALGRGLGLPDAGRCVPCRAASALGTAALTVAAEAAFPRAVVVGAGAAAFTRSAGCRRQAAA